MIQSKPVESNTEKIVELLVTILAIMFIFSLPFSETLKTISFLLLTIVFLVDQMVVRKERPIFTPLGIGLVVYSITGCLVTIFALNVQESFKGLLDIIKFSLVYLIFFNQFQDKKKIIEWSFIVSTTLAVFYSIIFWKFIEHKPHLEVMSLGHFNHTAIFLGLTIVFTICKIVWDEGSRKSMFSLCIFSIILMAGLILTTSRASILGLAAAIFFMLLYKANKKLLFILLLSAVISVFTFSFSKDFQRKALNPGSVISRLYIWKAGIRAFKDHLFFGVGLRCFGIIDDKYYGKHVGVRVGHAHNLFINHLTQMGIIGFLGLLSVFYGAFLTFRNSLDNYRKIAAYASLIFVIINGIFNTTLRWEHAIAFMIIASLVDYQFSKIHPKDENCSY